MTLLVTVLTLAIGARQGNSTLVEGNVRNNCNTEAVAVWGDAQLVS